MLKAWGKSRRVAGSSGCRYSFGTSIQRAPVTEPALFADDYDALADDLRRETAGAYEVLRVLGRGGMAAVYLAHDVALNRKVAIKAILPDLRARPDMRQRFLLEARTSARLSHPHIIPIHAVRDSPHVTFFVMEYLDGQSLEEMLCECGRLEPVFVTEILVQVAEALAYAHGHRVVHRDVKPGNVILSHDGRAVVMDFGIAKVAESTGLTQTGTAVGTPSYMSPEQCHGTGVTGASDQYSLGLVAYELLTGLRPFEQDSVMATLWAQVHEAAPSLYHARPDCPPDLAAVVMRMVEKDPAARWPDLATVVEALRESERPGATRADLRALGGTVEAAPDRESGPRLVVPTGRLRVWPEHAEAAPGDSWQMVGSVFGPDGTAVHEPIVQWSVDDPSVIALADDGTVRVVGAGRAVVTGRWSGLEGESEITVTRVGAARVEVRRLAPVTHVGAVTELAAQVTDNFGHELRDRVVRWESSNPEVASVLPIGELHALSPGPVEISAICGPVRGTKQLRVEPAVIASLRVHPHEPAVSVGDRLTLQVLVTDPAGRSLPASSLRWISSNPQYVRVSETGEIEALHPGEARIVARSGGKSAFARVRVSRKAS